ncbi:hypothetical protein ABEW34_24955 [Paenibacillus algorifonticola]|uniref:hypothetical protein n=1 Tax=Paenibacillus algorifonticola TaxID=684063 RepID=UPI003D2E26EA
MAVSTKRFAILVSIIVIVVIAVFSWIKLIQYTWEDSRTVIHKTITEIDILNVKATTVTYVRNGESVKVENHEIALTQEEIHQLIQLFNNVQENRVFAVPSVKSNIVLGILITMVDRTQVRIQYDSTDVYVTRTDKSSTTYKVEQEELKSFIEELKNHN